MKQEIWKPIKGFEGYYQVSNLGRIKSLAREEVVIRKRPEAIMKLGYGTHSNGIYYNVTLSKNGKKVYPRVNRLVAEHFCEKKEGCNVVNHLDSVSTNNEATNLEWTTTLGNVRHSWKFGNQKPQNGEKNGHSKFVEKDILKIRELANTGNYTHQELSEVYNVRRETITKIINHQRWRHI